MYIIAGLGNPGKQYAQTRHNVGFDTIDILADKYNISVDTKKHKALCGKGMIEGQKVVLAKPQTFMNLSGESVRELVDFYKIDPEEELIVIYDDISPGAGTAPHPSKRKCRRPQWHQKHHRTSWHPGF